MSATITYKGNTLTTVDNATKKLNTKGKYLEDDITITDSTSGIDGDNLAYGASLVGSALVGTATVS